MKRELGLDSNGIQKTMRTSDYLADGVGMLAINGMAGIVGQMTYFYTDKVGMAAGAVATVLLLCKIIDAFSDLVMGKIVDKTRFKSGERCRPWFKIMIIPTFLIIILMFTVPKASSGVQLAYEFITNVLISAVVYTAVTIPYSSLLSLRTKSQEERGKMGIVRAIFSYAIGMVLAILIVPITNLLGGDQAAWIKFGVIVAGIAAISLFIVYRRTKELGSEEGGAKEERPEDADVPFGEALNMLFHNKYWVIILFANLFMGIAAALSSSSGVYYAKWILGNDNLTALLGAVGLIPTIVGFIVVGPMTKKFGMAKASYISAAIGVIACGIRVFIPYSLAGTLILGCFSGFATMIPMCLTGAMVNNCVEYNEWKYGKRIVGMTNSAYSFGGKIASGIGGSLIGWLLALGGYSRDFAVQPQGVVVAIFAFTIYIPLVLFLGQFILFRKFDLEKKYAQILKDIEARKKG